jgi:hypothetical protein
MKLANEQAIPHVQAGKRLRGDHCRCAACRQSFNSTKAFDKHRVGSYPTRRCLAIIEMQALGMVLNAGGWWITERRENGRSSFRRSSRSGDLARPAVQGTPT